MANGARRYKNNLGCGVRSSLSSPHAQRPNTATPVSFLSDLLHERVSLSSPTSYPLPSSTVAAVFGLHRSPSRLALCARSHHSGPLLRQL